MLTALGDKQGKMKKNVFLIITVLVAGLLTASSTYGQNGRTLYLELFGASNGLGVNYDARFDRDGSTGWGWRTGLGFGYRYSSTGLAYDFSEKSGTQVGETTEITISHIYNQSFRASVPLEINYLLGSGPSKLDLGAGGLFCADLYTAADGAKPHLAFGVSPYLSAGYRLVTEKRFVFRAGFMSPFTFRTREFPFWPYISFGRAF